MARIGEDIDINNLWVLFNEMPKSILRETSDEELLSRKFSTEIGI